MTLQRAAVLVSAATLVLIIMIIGTATADHPVGEPELEASPQWQSCCHDRDCVPHEIKWVYEHGKFYIVTIDGDLYQIHGKKFFPAPTTHSWVCYININERPIDENVRCVLYPQGRNYS